MPKSRLQDVLESIIEYCVDTQRLYFCSMQILAYRQRKGLDCSTKHKKSFTDLVTASGIFDRFDKRSAADALTRKHHAIFYSWKLAERITVSNRRARALSLDHLQMLQYIEELRLRNAAASLQPSAPGRKSPVVGCADTVVKSLEIIGSPEAARNVSLLPIIFQIVNHLRISSDRKLQLMQEACDTSYTNLMAEILRELRSR